MRLKPVPATPPPEIDAVDGVATVRDALPLVPRSEDDCCVRIVDRVAWIGSREDATAWIAFLRALALAERSGASYARVRGQIDREELARHLRANVLGAEAAIDALDQEPRSSEAVFEATADVVPEWERRRSDTWREAWAARTARLLDWAALLGLANRVDDGYVRT